MSRILLYAAVGALAAFIFLGAASAQTRFLVMLDDVPLPPCLRENEPAGFVFDGPEGRIIGAAAEGVCGRREVEGFYAEVLPALGWRRGARAYERGAERLALETVRGADGRDVVRFTLVGRTGG